MDSVSDVIEQLVSVGDLFEREIDRQGFNQTTMLLEWDAEVRRDQRGPCRSSWMPS